VQAKEVDLEFEYLVCALKRMARPLPHPTAELLQRIVQQVPLYEQLRAEIDATFKPAETTRYRSVRKNSKAIQQLQHRVTAAATFSQTEAAAKPSPKAFPLSFAFKKFEKKIEKLAKGRRFEKNDAIVIGDIENLDELEQEIL